MVRSTCESMSIGSWQTSATGCGDVACRKYFAPRHYLAIAPFFREKEAGGLGEEALQEERLDSYMDG